MKTTTSNSTHNEAGTARIPQLASGARHDRVPASAVRPAEAETEAADAAIAQETATAPGASAAARWSGLAGVAPSAKATAARRRSIVSTIRDILDTAEGRANRAEERARQAEELLALHERHCICRAGKVAEAIAAEAVRAGPVAASDDGGKPSAADAKAEADPVAAARASASPT